jgi:hypothetical protein
MRPSQGGGSREGDAQAAAPKREKTSFALSSDAKFKLTSLKADLRRRGHAATESAILEALIFRADPTDSFLHALDEANKRRRNTTKDK